MIVDKSRMYLLFKGSLLNRKSSDFRITYSSCAIFLLLLMFLNSYHCDHLKQTDDKQTTEQSAQPTVATSDPELFKKELKDLIKMKVDTDKDGYVSYEELKNYLAVLHEKNMDFNVDKQWNIYQPQIHEVFSWEGYEPEKREVLTWDHYFNQTYPELVGVDIGIPMNREQDTSRILNPQAETDKQEEIKAKKSEGSEDVEVDPHMKMLRVMVKRADERWKLADENGDTLLTKQEFKFLLHPDEGYEELQNLFVREATEDMDIDKDGKICLDEFMKHLQVLVTEQERNDHHWLSSQQENFGRFLDKNKDGVLDGDEIKDWLVPAKSKKFELEAKRLLEVGDLNDDHKLSNAELLEHYDQYMSLLPAEFWKNEQMIEDHENQDQVPTPTLDDDHYTEVPHDEL